MSDPLYCRYCRCRKGAGTKFFLVRDRKTRRVINKKCADCVARGKLPQDVRDARGKKHGEMLRGASAKRQQELKEILKQQALKRAREEKA